MSTQVTTLFIGSVRVKTTVITSVSELDQSLKGMLSAIYADDKRVKRVVSLHIEKEHHEYHSDETKVTETVSKVILCYNTTCLIIDLINMKGGAPLSLSKFLQLQQLAFVGMGINLGLAALEKDYGIKCRNAVDLGHLAANVHNNGVVVACGLLDLAEKVCPLEHDVKSSIHRTLKSLNVADLLGHWRCSEQQVKAATLDAWLCFYLGNVLIGRCYGQSSNVILE